MAVFHSLYYSDVHHLFEELNLFRMMLLLQCMLNTIYQVTISLLLCMKYVHIGNQANFVTGTSLARQIL